MKSRKLYVGNLDRSVTRKVLEELFSPYGDVDEVKINSGDGFGFVEMSCRSEAERAKQALNGYELHGRALAVEEVRLSLKEKNARRFKKAKTSMRSDHHKTFHLEGW